MKRRELLLAVFGDPVAHSLSPAMHGAALAAMGRPGRYLRFRVPARSLAAALRGAAALGFRGINLTIPLKEAALGCVDVLTPVARKAGAVNTVTIEGARLTGHSTDGEGFLRSLADAWPAFGLRGRRVIVCGAGGAARSVLFALAGAGAAELVVVNRSARRAARLARRVAAATGVRTVTASPRSPAVWRALTARAGLLVNATPLGMHGEMAAPAGALRPALRVCDLIYAPPVTPLLAAARRIGAPAVNGEGMLVHQGALALTRWTGRPAPVAVMRRALRRALAQRAGLLTRGRLKPGARSRP